MPKIIEKNPKILGGQPVIKGTRIPVARVVALYVQGYKLSDIKKELPDLSEFTKKDLSTIFSYYKATI
ncbi:MAG: hypothetical protein A2W22_04795 [Candidatus Levybacteria bacterium RBG_16_35_11]|nr:MAG: hypothetical protein A2W22_04795 [Candidatus Levybacteria bacterium RBG_16_35_11]